MLQLIDTFRGKALSLVNEPYTTFEQTPSKMIKSFSPEYCPSNLRIQPLHHCFSSTAASPHTPLSAAQHSKDSKIRHTKLTTVIGFRTIKSYNFLKLCCLSLPHLTWGQLQVFWTFMSIFFLILVGLNYFTYTYL